jgi:hypothetical protein
VLFNKIYVTKPVQNNLFVKKTMELLLFTELPTASVIHNNQICFKVSGRYYGQFLLNIFYLTFVLHYINTTVKVLIKTFVFVRA